MKQLEEETAKWERIVLGISRTLEASLVTKKRKLRWLSKSAVSFFRNVTGRRPGKTNWTLRRK